MPCTLICKLNVMYFDQGPLYLPVRDLLKYSMSDTALIFCLDLMSLRRVRPMGVRPV